MRPILALSTFVFLGLFAAPGAAQAYCVPHFPTASDLSTTICLNNPADNSCHQLGETTMDGDGKNIIACALVSAPPAPGLTCATAPGGCAWKTMSTAGDLRLSELSCFRNTAGAPFCCRIFTQTGETHCLAMTMSNYTDPVFPGGAPPSGGVALYQLSCFQNTESTPFCCRIYTPTGETHCLLMTMGNYTNPVFP